MSKTSKTKTASKKPVAKQTAKTTRALNALQAKLLKIFHRPQGATMQEITKAGANRPAISALRMFETRGYKTSIVKGKNGEPNRYIVRA